MISGVFRVFFSGPDDPPTVRVSPCSSFPLRVPRRRMASVKVYHRHEHSRSSSGYHERRAYDKYRDDYHVSRDSSHRYRHERSRDRSRSPHRHEPKLRERSPKRSLKPAEDCEKSRQEKENIRINEEEAARKQYEAKVRSQLAEVLEADSVDEEKARQERQKRLAAILASRTQDPPLLVASPTSASTSSSHATDVATSSAAPPPPPPESSPAVTAPSEPLPATVPTSLLTTAPAASASSAPPANDSAPADMFDMFSDTDVVVAPRSVATLSIRHDEWDDAEGYLRVIVGDVLVDRYSVVQILGRGAFSSVLFCRDLKAAAEEENSQVDVAIKLIRSNDELKRHGMKELSTCRQIAEADPQNKYRCVRLLNHFETRGHLCLVFERLDMDARQLMKKYSKGVGFPLAIVRSFAQQLARALHLLSHLKLVHADLKPDNVLVNEKTNLVKLADFNTVVPVAANAVNEEMQSRFYRAPETILGLPLDCAVDVWSLGVMLYELYTGKVLFPGRSNNEMLRLIQEARGPVPRKAFQKGLFLSKHFDAEGSFLQTERDSVTAKRDIVRKVGMIRQTRDLRAELIATNVPLHERELLTSFVSFLERCLVLDPRKRITAPEALAHPFLRA